MISPKPLVTVQVQYINHDNVVNTDPFMASLTYLLRGDSSCELGRGWSYSVLADLGLFLALLPCSPECCWRLPWRACREVGRRTVTAGIQRNGTLGCVALTVGGGGGKEVAGV